jgi:hypothetical protein
LRSATALHNHGDGIILAAACRSYEKTLRRFRKIAQMADVDLPPLPPRRLAITKLCTGVQIDFNFDSSANLGCVGDGRLDFIAQHRSNRAKPQINAEFVENSRR